MSIERRIKSNHNEKWPDLCSFYRAFFNQILKSFWFSAKDTCSRNMQLPQSESTSLGDTVVKGRKYPWAGMYKHKHRAKCAGSLGNFL
jgi:hypothetical protein